MAERRKQTPWKSNWPQIVLSLIILPMVGWLLIQDREQFKEADIILQKHDYELTQTTKYIQEALINVTSRVDRLETSYEIMIPRLIKNTDKMRDDLTAIRAYIYDIELSRERTKENKQ